MSTPKSLDFNVMVFMIVQDSEGGISP